jgi:hypothetical protein
MAVEAQVSQDRYREAQSTETGEAIRINVTLADGSTRSFRVGMRIVSSAMVLMIVSGLWGAFAAWWVALDKISGADHQRSIVLAKVVADEVTKALSAKHTTLPALAGQINGLGDRTESVPSSPEAKLSTKVERVPTGPRALLSKEHEAAAKSHIEGLPRTRLNVPDFAADQPIRINSISHFGAADRDIFRVNLASVDSGTTESGEIIVLAKYMNGDTETVVGCCDSYSSTQGQSKVPLGVLFRVKNGVEKFLEIAKPTGQIGNMVAFKVGLRTSETESPLFSEWVSAPKSK